MAEKTRIAWTRSTFNPWIGCTNVSPGCDHCYAEAQDARGRWDGGRKHWGTGVPRYRTSAANWRKPLAWNEKAAETGERWLVFCASLADVFDNEVPQQWRDDLFDLIRNTQALTWLVLSKRIGNAAKMLPDRWGQSWYREHVWLGVSVVNQEEADRDIPKLLATPAAKRFVSYEPALGPVDFSKWLAASALREIDGGPAVDWIIVGGESGPKARPFDVAHAYSVVRQCRAAGVSPFVKQLGSFCIDRNDAGFVGDGDDRWPIGTDDKIEFNPFGYIDEYQGAPVRVKFRSLAGADPAEWPEDLRVQEFPQA